MIRDRLMAGQLVLVQSIGVRIPIPEPDNQKLLPRGAIFVGLGSDQRIRRPERRRARGGVDGKISKF